MKNNIITGSVVSGNRHEYPMTVHEIDGQSVTVNYFDKSDELHTEEYSLSDLEVIQP